MLTEYAISMSGDILLQGSHQLILVVDKLIPMDQEDRIFYENELDYFAEGDLSNFTGNYQNTPHLRPQSIENAPLPAQSTQQDYQSFFKAYNPMNVLKDLPQEKQNEYFFMFNNHKRFNGIQHFFEFGNEDKFSPQFLQNIHIDALGNSSNNNFELDKLFVGENKNSYKQQLQNSIISLNKKMEEINQKVIGNMNINKTISNAFYEHFQNYSLVIASSTFRSEFQSGLNNLIANSKKLKGPGVELISSIYEFWMKSFKDFVSQIWKFSSKFTLNFFKKQEPQQCFEMNSSEIKSESSNTMGSKDKRKGWTNQETEILEQLINSNFIFGQSVMKKLANQFSRSANSISSKIQKLIKSKKGCQDNPQESLLKKTIEILKMHPEGLNREGILQRMNENYEMGYGGQWQKSVGQLLSSRKEFIKLKCKYKLINPQQYKIFNFSESDKSKLTFKDKVVQLFLNFPNAEADLKTLVEQYAFIFEDVRGELDEERRKSIEANISKTISRYDIFDGKIRTLYLLNPLFSKTEARNMDVEVEQFFQL